MADAVTGTTRVGVAPVPLAPVVIGGIDGSGNVQALLTGTDGSVTRGQSSESVIYASASRTSDPTVVDQTNNSCVGLVVVINCTAVSGSSSVVFTIQGKNSLGVLYTILASAAIVGTGVTVLRVYPDLTAAANTKATDLIPRTWNIKAVHGTADATTYSVTACLIP